MGSPPASLLALSATATHDAVTAGGAWVTHRSCIPRWVVAPRWRRSRSKVVAHRDRGGSRSAGSGIGLYPRGATGAGSAARERAPGRHDQRHWCPLTGRLDCGHARPDDGQCGCAAHARLQGRRHRGFAGRGDRPARPMRGPDPDPGR